MDLGSAIWRKSTYSGGNGGNCVEVASNLPGVIVVRDSKGRSGPVLTFTHSEWHAFIGGARDGEFDLDGSCRFPDGSATHQGRPPTDCQLAGTGEADIA
jgi:hypothetical protein